MPCHVTIIVIIKVAFPLVMKKMGRQFLSVHQLCFAHGIHLAVCEVMYKKPKKKPKKKAATRKTTDTRPKRVNVTTRLSTSQDILDALESSDGSESEVEDSDDEEGKWRGIINYALKLHHNTRLFYR